MNKIFGLACLGEFLLLPFAMDFVGHAFLSGEAVRGSPEIAVTGCIASEHLHVLCNPAVATPSLQLDDCREPEALLVFRPLWRTL